MVRKTKTRKARERMEAAAAVMRRQGREDIPSDVQGSYTGTGEDNEYPVQDADDL